MSGATDVDVDELARGHKARTAIERCAVLPINRQLTGSRPFRANSRNGSRRVSRIGGSAATLRPQSMAVAGHEVDASLAFCKWSC